MSSQLKQPPSTPPMHQQQQRYSINNNNKKRSRYEQQNEQQNEQQQQLSSPDSSPSNNNNKTKANKTNRKSSSSVRKCLQFPPSSPSPSPITSISTSTKNSDENFQREQKSGCSSHSHSRSLQLYITKTQSCQVTFSPIHNHPHPQFHKNHKNHENFENFQNFQQQKSIFDSMSSSTQSSSIEELRVADFAPKACLSLYPYITHHFQNFHQNFQQNQNFQNFQNEKIQQNFQQQHYKMEAHDENSRIMLAYLKGLLSRKDEMAIVPVPHSTMQLLIFDSDVFQQFSSQKSENFENFEKHGNCEKSKNDEKNGENFEKHENLLLFDTSLHVLLVNRYNMILDLDETLVRTRRPKSNEEQPRRRKLVRQNLQKVEKVENLDEKLGENVQKVENLQNVKVKNGDSSDTSDNSDNSESDDDDDDDGTSMEEEHEFHVDGVRYICCVRPGTNLLLSWAHSIFNVVIVTNSVLEYAKQIVHILDPQQNHLLHRLKLLKHEKNWKNGENWHEKVKQEEERVWRMILRTRIDLEPHPKIPYPLGQKNLIKLGFSPFESVVLDDDASVWSLKEPLLPFEAIVNERNRDAKSFFCAVRMETWKKLHHLSMLKWRMRQRMELERKQQQLLVVEVANTTVTTNGTVGEEGVEKSGSNSSSCVTTGNAPAAKRIKLDTPPTPVTFSQNHCLSAIDSSLKK